MTEESFENEVSRALGRIEAKQDALHDTLLSPGGRIVKLEEAQAWAEKKQWIHSAIVIPITAALLQIGKKSGLL